MILRRFQHLLLAAAAAALPAAARADESAPRPAQQDDAAQPALARSWLGVWVEPLAHPAAEQLGLAKGSGLTIKAVADESPAKEADIRKGDVVTRVRDQIVWTADQFACILDSHAPGQQIELHLMRAGEPVVLSATLDTRPEQFLPRVRRIATSGGDRPALADIATNYGEMREIPANKEARSAGDNDDDNAQTVLNDNVRVRMQGIPPPAGEPAIRIRRAENAEILIRDNQGSIHLQSRDGRTMLHAKNTAGDTIHDGPYETDEEKAMAPAEVRERAERFLKRNSNLERFFEPLGQADP